MKGFLGAVAAAAAFCSIAFSGSVPAATASPAGTVVAWGANNWGQTNVPAGLTDVTAIAAGNWHTLALKSDGTVVAWGQNGDRQTNVPAGLTGVTAVAAAGNHSLALKSDGTVVAWGSNLYGESTVPAGLVGVTAIAAGWYHSLALESDGTVVAWGYNLSGESSPPAGLTGVTAISSRTWHNLALMSDGTVVAWPPGSPQTNVPAGLSGVTAVSAGGGFSLALKSDGTVVAWGNNNFGQTDVPAGLTGVTAIAASAGNYSLALKSDGTVVAWGAGQTSVPAGLGGVGAIAAGVWHSVALIPVGDTTPPVISAPTGLIADAKAPTGANVPFTVTATDDSDPSPAVSCTPPSGSVFAIGTTSVNCTATDSSGNAAQAIFTVHVRGADEQLARLAAAVVGVGPGTSLADKVNAAQAAVRGDDAPSACSMLRAFINQLDAQSGKSITPSDAVTLIADAVRIRTVLDC